MIKAICRGLLIVPLMAFFAAVLLACGVRVLIERVYCRRDDNEFWRYDD